MSTDPYEVLGVERSATKDDIKKAYRRLAHQYHPDKEDGDEEKFKEVNAAYQILNDDEKRAQYDQFGSTFEGAGTGPGGFNVNWEDFGSVSDIFEQFFGGGRAGPFAGGPFGGASRVHRGEDIAIDVTLSFEESATGVERDVTHRLHQSCEHCHGNGAEPGTPIVTCNTCQGSGVQTREHRTMLGVMQSQAECTTCHGDGKVAETPCSTCRGEGRELRERTLEVAIPAGINDGQTIRLSGKGEVPPFGGVAGDLYVRVHVQESAGLTRDGDDVRSNVSVSFADAALGTTVSVSTLGGEQELTIPAGTQPGTELKLPGKGFPRLQASGVGDQVVTINVEVPAKVSRKQRKLLEEFQATGKKGLFG